ncbi:hypothetical protein lacNasYZ03_03000 [Lactobacillus nasalidis]|uniref:DUF6449 domain-containing protein n=1 Tax=Lactobacillus nasalidis TaxID=2797258 RepID=A0ABQ3W3X7_9LACO|nr:hypothetical protein lacNasYZ01_02030 [Lactobacillus nasalidis]GHV99107.1 hypothetical protein lacNasYZ02_05370 [Lactobacillus nasalidis]GHW00613.1 hypothetical protein lacNasYZ03_03000 [Lactobacillus nasalidis]
MALATLVMAMFYIVGPILVLISNKDVNAASLLYNARTYYIFQNMVLSAATAGIFGIYLAYEGFRFLHVPRQVDYYESQPISRKTRFLGIAVNSLLIYSLIYLVFFLAGMLLCAAAGSNFLADGGIWRGFLADLLVFSAWYGIASLSMMITGNTFVAALATIFFSCFEFGLMSLSSIFYSELATTAEYNNHTWLAYTNPSTQLYNSNHWLGMGINLLWTVLYLALAYWAYQKRANEMAGRAVAFAWIEQAVKILLVVFFAAVGGVFGYMIDGLNFACGIIGALLTGLLTASLMEIIFKFDLAAWKHNFLQSLLLTAAGVAVLAGLVWGAKRYDDWLPASGQVASVAISPSDGIYTNYYLGKGSAAVNADEYAAKYMSVPVTSDLLKLAKAGSKFTQNRSHDREDSVSLRFVFRMKNGRSRVRVYAVERKVLKKYFEPISKTKAYKQGYFQIYHDQLLMDNLDTMSFTYKNGKEAIKRQDSQLYKDFRAAYKQDLTKWDYLQASQQKPVGQVAVSWKRANGKQAKIYYPVYSNYSQTIAFLKKNKLYAAKKLSLEDQQPLDYYLDDQFD